MKTYYLVVCECGHKGEIRLSENDQPYSNNWESYSLQGLIGNPFSQTKSASWDEIFEKMAVSCPKCNRKLSIKNLVEK